MQRKHKRIYRGNIEGITKPAIKRLGILAGCDRLGGLMYEEVRGVLFVTMKDCLSKAVIHMQHAKRKTLLYKDLEAAVSMYGEKLYGDEKTVYKGCKNVEDLVKHKGNCVVLGKLPFLRLTKEILQDMATEDPRISKPFQENFQYYIERKMINYLATACQVAADIGKRKTVMPKDLQYVYQHKCSPVAKDILVKKKRATKRKTKK